MRFLLAAVFVLLLAAVLSTVHEALAAADRGEVAQPEITDLGNAESLDVMPQALTVGHAD